MFCIFLPKVQPPVVTQLLLNFFAKKSAADKQKRVQPQDLNPIYASPTEEIINNLSSFLKTKFNFNLKVH